jgi:hypothetical protein
VLDQAYQPYKESRQVLYRRSEELGDTIIPRANVGDGVGRMREMVILNVF